MRKRMNVLKASATCVLGLYVGSCMGDEPDEPAQGGKAGATTSQGGGHAPNRSGGAPSRAGRAGAFPAAGDNSAGSPDPASSGGARGDAAGAGQAGTPPEGGRDSGGAAGAEGGSDSGGAAGAEGCGPRDNLRSELQGGIVRGKFGVGSEVETTPNGGQTGIWQRCESITPSCQDHLDAGAGGDAYTYAPDDPSLAPIAAKDGYATLSLQPYNYAYAVNDHGHIVGVSPKCSSSAFLYKDGVFFDIAKGYPSSVANDINAAGVVVGSVGTGPSRPFVFRHGILDVLEEFEDAAAVAVNDQDQVLIASLTGGYVWQAGHVTELEASALTCACVVRPHGINNQGQVVGTCQRGSSYSGAFTWQNGVMTELSTFGLPWQEASAINDAGQIVGTGTRLDGQRVVVLWEGGNVRALESVTGVSSMIPTAINDLGTITFLHAGATPAYDNGTWNLLGGYLKGAPPWQMCGFDRADAFDINASGQIVGFGTAVCIDRFNQGIDGSQAMLWSPTCVGSCCPN